jgi:hypothetical protein
MYTQHIASSRSRVYGGVKRTTRFDQVINRAVDARIRSKLADVRDALESEIREKIIGEQLFSRVDSADTKEGHARFFKYLESEPYPHYEESGKPGLLVKVDKNGTKTIGRFVNRMFVAAK